MQAKLKPHALHTELSTGKHHTHEDNKGLLSEDGPLVLSSLSEKKTKNVIKVIAATRFWRALELWATSVSKLFTKIACCSGAGSICCPAGSSNPSLDPVMRNYDLINNDVSYALTF